MPEYGDPVEFPSSGVKEFDDLIRQTATEMGRQLMGKFMPIPSFVCGCGKPIVFIEPRNSRINPVATFECSRCGKKWGLSLSLKLME